MHLLPITLKQANRLVVAHHRHLPQPVAGARFAIGVAWQDGTLIGAVVVGRPSAHALQDGTTAQVTRLVVQEGVPNACSMLYGAAWRAWKAMGGTRCITYTLASEPGTSLRAAGWVLAYTTRAMRAKGWDTPARPRQGALPLFSDPVQPQVAKCLWVAGAAVVPSKESRSYLPEALAD